MRGGNKAFLATAALAVTGCTSDDGKLSLRTIADPLAAAAKRGSPMVVEGRAALALGNTGTALEAFRKALREKPDSIEALAGIAACYERMGRYDLARINYEAALAIAPNNPILLNSFAASLQLQGRHSEANALRAEAAQAEAAEIAAVVKMAQADIEPVAPAAQAVVQPAPVSPPVRAVVQPEPVSPPIRAAERVAQTSPRPATAVAAASNEAPAAYKEKVGNTEWTIEVPTKAEAAASVTVALPPAIPAKPVPANPGPADAPAAVAARQPAPATPPSPAPVKEAPAMVVAIVPPKPQGAQPRLERLSMGEVALLTGGGPAWRTEVVAQSQRSVTARFVPLKGAATTPQAARFVPLKTAMAANRPNIRLLNAARRQGLAARTRETLLDRGWRKIAIGDAAQVHARSIVLYPAGRQVLGKRLAAQFGFASAVNSRSDEVLVLLGRDAASLTFRRARG